MAVNKLAFLVAFDQTGFVKDFQMVRDGGGSNALQGHYVPAIHVFTFITGNGLKNHETSLIGQSL